MTDSCGHFARSIGQPGRNPRHSGAARTLLIRLTACVGFSAFGAVLEEMNQQRALVIAAISTERRQAMLAMANDFALERTQLLREVEAQRLATLQWATGERRETIGDVRRDLAGAVSALRAERSAFTDDVRHLIDVVLLRVALFVVAGVVLAPLVAHVYARVWPRKTP